MHPIDGYELFKKEFPLAFDKIKSDLAITDEVKSVFFEYMKMFKGLDVDDLANYADDFFKQHKLKGKKVSLESNEVLGRVIDKIRLQLLLRNTGKDSIAWLDNLLADNIDLSQEEILQDIRDYLGDIELNRFLLWAYRNEENPSDPFFRIELKMLPCLLGLPSAEKPSAHYAWGIKLPVEVPVHLPTAFDPGIDYLNNVWEPGGRTKPLTDLCGEQSGLLEVVIPGSHTDKTLVNKITFEHISIGFKEIMPS